MNSHQKNINAGGPNADDDSLDHALGTAQAQISATGVDDLLDEIDGLLENNAEEFVRSYVQKGGQ
ncbi:Ubiquitin-like protein [Corynebacterium pseudotuberculosis]|uniref:ubiquitin-like protein Pup n=1 Tax=Corynebacterium pseudotuberculosis TaxID=1719 RepID=UPI00065E0A31|nr:ubiquitin-like protein Pup [Corynebacterium pseudotuberculosis]AKP08696.1 Ubiquitin-like protein [Corynebacterium pseudotuberculosis]